jgi:RNA polymerase sigma-70 factor (family 1)
MKTISANEDNNLIQQLKSSNVKSFNNVFQLYNKDLFNFLYYKLGDLQAAEDILQDVFITLWENRHHLKEGLSIQSYLYTLAKNLAFNYLRHQKVIIKYHQKQSIKTTEEQSHNPQTIQEEKELHDLLLTATGKLSEMQRIVFMMSRFDQLSNKEIAERLEISIKTVETHLGRALKKLDSILKSVL